MEVYQTIVLEWNTMYIDILELNPFRVTNAATDLLRSSNLRGIPESTGKKVLVQQLLGIPSVSICIVVENEIFYL